MAKKYVYFFGAGKAEGSQEMKNLLGGKGANLAEMTNIGIPVPPGFTITTEVCKVYYEGDRNYPPELDIEIGENLKKLEDAMRLKLGDPEKPLLVSVRSGARVSMPGICLLYTSFAHAQGVDVSDLIIKEEPKGKFVYAILRVPGPEAISALKGVFTRFVRGLSFERAMRWGDGGFRFVRPIRWLLALLGEDVIDIEINDIKGDRFTSGHRFLTSGIIEISRAEDYFAILEGAYCIVNQDKRRAIVEKGIEELAEGAGGEVAEDDKLLTELTYLAEHPAPLAGRFDSDLLSLPKEVIVTSMKAHQRFFPVPVSYTHLDVYKRQPFGCLRLC